MRKITLLFYVFGSIFITLPLIFYKIKFLNLNFIRSILKIFHFRLDIKAIFLLILSSIIFFIYDIFLFKNKNQLKKNIIMFEQILGKGPNISLNLIISVLSGYFEELLFRGYIYFLLINIIQKNYFFNIIYIEIILIIIISLLFAFFHIIQGKEVFIFSFLISIIFFISIKLSGSIWYAVLFHSIINFIEFTFLIPYQKKFINYK